MSTKKFCLDLQEQKDKEKATFSLENGSEKILNKPAAEWDYTRHKIGLGKPRTNA